MDDSFLSAIFPNFEIKLSEGKRSQEGRTGHCVAKVELMQEGGWKAGEVDNEKFRKTKVLNPY